MLLAGLGATIAPGGCGSAGGTAGVLDIGSVWYKHPTTGDVKECGGGFYPGVQIRRYYCGKQRQWTAPLAEDLERILPLLEHP